MVVPSSSSSSKIQKAFLIKNTCTAGVLSVTWFRLGFKPGLIDLVTWNMRIYENIFHRRISFLVEFNSLKSLQ